MADEDIALDSSSPEVTLAYYRHLYPFKQISAWLSQSHAPTKMLTHREFAFTLPGEVYLRYQSFASHEEFKKHVLQLNPSRFEIGPVYTARPKDKKSCRPGAFIPTERELIFDIDLTDYDSIRTCCSSANICSRCWGFITAAVTTLHNALTEEFGFKLLLWVYSGRRGVHCWVSDREACEMSDETRKSIVGWLAVLDGMKGGKISVRGAKGLLVPSVQSCLGPLADTFTSLILNEQNLFESDEKYEALLTLIPIPSVVSALQEEWQSDPLRDSNDKWSDIKSHVRSFSKGSAERVKLTAALEDIIITYTYPRLDSAVSKHLNHLLKAPFCVHPKTGRICVPFDPAKAEEFKPEEVPTVAQLLKELNTAMMVEGEEVWEHTSLKPYIQMLEKHAATIMEANRRIKPEKVDLTW